MKKLFLILSLVGFICFVACDPQPPIDDPIDDPTKDTTVVDTTDTLPPDTIPVDTTVTRVDTIQIDTVAWDSIINLDNNRVVCAYVSWYGDKLPDPFKVTNVCFAFAELYVVNGVYQKFDISGGSQGKGRFKKVLQLKEKNPNLQIELSFSHVCENTDNAQGGGFSMMAKSPEQRKQFCEDCLAFVKANNLDGIDIDWELPGLSWSGHACDPLVDADNYTALMKDLRETLGPDYLLTYAGYVKDKEKLKTGGYKYIDNMAVEPYVDWFNVMTYDIDSPPQPHNAMTCSGWWDLTRMQRQFATIGFPMNKMVLGIPFYGRGAESDDTAEYQYWYIEGMARQRPDIWEKCYSEYWKVPYMKKNGKMVCSYDDASSIAYKSKWALSKGMRGLMWWEQSGDDTKGTLTTACWNGMKTETQHWAYYIYYLSDGTEIRTEPTIVE